MHILMYVSRHTHSHTCACMPNTLSHAHTYMNMHIYRHTYNRHTPTCTYSQEHACPHTCNFMRSRTHTHTPLMQDRKSHLVPSEARGDRPARAQEVAGWQGRWTVSTHKQVTALPQGSHDWRGSWHWGRHSFPRRKERSEQGSQGHRGRGDNEARVNKAGRSRGQMGCRNCYLRHTWKPGW